MDLKHDVRAETAFDCNCKECLIKQDKILDKFPEQTYYPSRTYQVIGFDGRTTETTVNGDWFSPCF
jgi:hypothetical protein